MASARLVTLILVEDTVGAGVVGDPVQSRQMLFTLDGRPVASRSALGDLNHVNSDSWDGLPTQEWIGVPRA